MTKEVKRAKGKKMLWSIFCGENLTRIDHQHVRFGFVSFKDPNDFMKAMKEMNGLYIYCLISGPADM